MEFNCALEGKEIRRKYKKFVLDVPELRVPKGYATALVGENGAGKTTLMFFSEYHSSLLDPLTYVRFIGHIFGHAGWDHFIGNMLLFLVIAPRWRSATAAAPC